MNTTTIIIGAAFLAFGLYTSILRYSNPQKLTRLQGLKELFGAKTGDRVHLIAYAVIPAVAGAIFLFAGTRGVSLF